MRSSALGALGWSFVALLTVATPVLAQSKKVAAEALFEEGRKLVAARKADEACPKFAESQRLDASISTLLNLGNCYELTGKLASAWVNYKEAVSAATAQGRKDLLATAEKRVEKVTPKLSKLTIKGPDLAGLEVKRDGETVERSQLGVAIPIDGGSHTVTASAPGKRPFTTTVTVAKEVDAQTVTIPALEDLPKEAPPPATTSARAPSSSAPPRPPTTASASLAPPSDRKTLGLVVGGVGVAGLVASTAIVFLVAKPKYDDSLDHCRTDNKDQCDAQGKDLRDKARSAGNLATIVGGVGVVALAAGGVLYATSGGEPKAGKRVVLTPAVGANGGGAVLSGKF